MKVRKLLDSFNFAIDGILYTLKTQRNMRIHFTAAILVLFLSLFFDISKLEMLILFFTIALVIIAEMINTSIEATIDLITNQYHELAKIAKNVAAGAVFIAALNAIIVAYVIFFNKLDQVTEIVLHKVRHVPMHITFISFIIVGLIVISLKAFLGGGTPFRGGMPSGHTAIAFSILTSVAWISENTFIITLCFIMALLVAESRFETRIHSLFQVIIGALLGVFITLMIFQMIQ
ncbi:diacylglycerol kinase (ATP) [Geosporobacter subterraneus DSM 17957]|uniref:Diacylglycerol kinase (ATP) n=1 Tax=Geosporobacter subterraneus DSM 17957 TaxID=1121919 RepID=A0A1M6JJF0_9FIRM|nr:diacylglycerol kinase [Geosporobacter subterraneus]SHJ46755.1 diacylglycerol kinase (ATP) [Geosporobacter subterraneus DSM 17957]